MTGDRQFAHIGSQRDQFGIPTGPKIINYKLEKKNEIFKMKNKII